MGKHSEGMGWGRKGHHAAVNMQTAKGERWLD